MWLLSPVLNHLAADICINSVRQAQRRERTSDKRRRLRERMRNVRKRERPRETKRSLNKEGERETEKVRYSRGAEGHTWGTGAFLSDVPG